MLPHTTIEELNQLILVEKTKEELGVDSNKLGRHSSIEVYFKCVVCGEPHKLSKKRLLDAKGLTHPGECRTIFRKEGGKRARQTESQESKQYRILCTKKAFLENKTEILEKRKQSRIEKYGTNKTSEIESIRNNISNGVKQAHKDNGKSIINQRRETNKERYSSINYLSSEIGKMKVTEHNQKTFGTNYPFQNKKFQAKARENYTTNTGFENPSKNSEINQKRKQTNINIYGVVNPTQNDNVRKKIEQTNIVRYGYACASQSLEVRKKIGISLSTGELISDIYRLYNVPPCSAQRILKTYGEQAFLDFCKNYSGPPITALEQRMIRILEPEICTEHYNQKPIETADITNKPDFRLTNQNMTIYVNTDGLYWHSEANLTTDYHRNLRIAFKNHSLFLMQFRENEIRDKPEIVKSIVLSNLGIYQTKIHARKCEIKEVKFKQAKEFFKENHLMGSTTAITYGLFYQQKLVSAMSIRRKDDGIEIARLCTKLNTSVRGGFSKLLSHIIKIYDPAKVVSFCDLRYATGKSYEINGFKLESISQGWEWTDFENTYNRLKCKANMDDRKLTQQQHADELRWYKIYDAGQAKYVKYL